MLSLLVLAQQQPFPQAAIQSTQPFFTNDGIGLVKLFGLAVAIVGPVLALVYKLSFNGTRDEMAVMRRDLNGYGEVANQLKLDQRGCDTKVGGMERQITQLDSAVQQAKVQMAEIRTGLANMSTQQGELQRDIMHAITEGNRAIEKSITDLKVEQARLDERGKLADALSGITEVLRDIRTSTNEGKK